MRYFLAGHDVAINNMYSYSSGKFNLKVVCMSSYHVYGLKQS